MTDGPRRSRHGDRGLTTAELAVVTLVLAVLAVILLAGGTG